MSREMTSFAPQSFPTTPLREWRRKPHIFPPMVPSWLRPHLRLAVGWILLASAGCGQRGHSASSSAGGPPRAEFLVATQDSTFWVTTTGSKIGARGAPLTLAQYDGRFFEVFLADDDRSYEDALLVGFRLYRRDLIQGDSTVVFEDSIVPRVAREYAKAHPSAHRLSPDEDGREDPAT